MYTCVHEVLCRSDLHCWPSSGVDWTSSWWTSELTLLLLGTHWGLHCSSFSSLLLEQLQTDCETLPVGSFSVCVLWSTQDRVFLQISSRRDWFSSKVCCFSPEAATDAGPVDVVSVWDVSSGVSCAVWTGSVCERFKSRLCSGSVVWIADTRRATSSAFSPFGSSPRSRSSARNSDTFSFFTSSNNIADELLFKIKLQKRNSSH